MTAIFRGVVDLNHPVYPLQFQQPHVFKKWLHTVGHGKRVDVTVKKVTRKRTLPMNRYYWGVVVDYVSEYTGYTPPEAHEALKFEFASGRDPATGLIVTESTTSMSIPRFQKYVEEIQMFASENWELVIPDPNQEDFL